MPPRNDAWPLAPRCDRLRARAWTGVLLILLLTFGSPSPAAPAKKSLESVPPRPLREARGAWIATVANLDWPSKPGLPVAQQKGELLAILDKAVQLHLNVLIFQVRPNCDALYASTLEPWSEFLTGQMGKAPEPFYDPLAFAVDEAHRRGLELHAWFNPFRVRAPIPKNGIATNYISRAHPELIRNYGAQLWLDPGSKTVHEHCLRVILDVVRRYDIDGVHLDDYFYPYPEKNGAGQPLDFPDDPTWQRYRAGGGKLTRSDWRRKNIDDFVETLYRRIKAEKRWVKLGISPFGIWRPGSPKQVKKGLDAYECLYADSRKWVANGWLDYLSPQLYWSIESVDQSYPILLDWWRAQNAKARHLWPGNDLTKVGGPWPTTEIVKQIRLTRRPSGATGNLLWNMSCLMRNQNALADTLAHALYSQPALVPASSWLDAGLPAKPQLTLEPADPTHCPKAVWTNPGGKDVWLWLCQFRTKGKWTTMILPRDQTSWSLPRRTSTLFPDLVAVTAIDRCGGAGPTALFDTRQAGAPAKPGNK
jgi:uncharacterized lipoprotein YddW (UPF0748 family)